MYDLVVFIRISNCMSLGQLGINSPNIGTSIIIKGNIKMRVNRLNPVQKATYLKKKKEKWEQMKNVQ